MLRITFCTLAMLGFGSAARAGELDREAAPKAGVVASVSTSTAKAPVGTELDKESPQAAYHGHGGWGHGGFGYGGWGHGWGYGGWGRGWGGYGGWGYSGFGYGGWYRPYYAGFYPGYYGYSPFGWNRFAWYW